MNKPAKLPEGIIAIHGKEYQTVAYRLDKFRQEYNEEYGIATEILQNSELVVVRAVITARADGFVVATGTAEERRGTTQINKTSALENCETSAIGRALGVFGMGGTEFATANEVQNAIHQQNAGEGSGTGTKLEDSTVSPAAPISDADWAMVAQLAEVTKANVPAMLKHLRIVLPDNNLKHLSQQDAQRVIAALNDKLAKMVREETDTKAKEEVQ